MTMSMTAFARSASENQIASVQFFVEIRSLNQRFLEINCKLPSTFLFLENDIRQLVQSYIYRGKIEISLIVRNVNGSFNSLNTEALHDWLLVFANSGVMETLGKPDWNTMVNLPGVMGDTRLEKEVLSEAILGEVRKVMGSLLDMRQREGEKISLVLQEQLKSISELLANIELQLPEIERRLVNNLESKIEALKVEVDRARFEQEVVYLLSKSDIREELDRLAFHIKETLQTLKQKGSIGRRLDFLMQEFNREANTLGAKAADNRLSKAAVDLKVLIEQMREQIQNVE